MYAVTSSGEIYRLPTVAAITISVTVLVYATSLSTNDCTF